MLHCHGDHESLPDDSLPVCHIDSDKMVVCSVRHVTGLEDLWTLSISMALRSGLEMCCLSLSVCNLVSCIHMVKYRTQL